ncbi:MAG: AAA family ATPase [Candidatus Dadabacteria bacterium]|nr:AAA family ATPase [Candidatus Dadabacteria bacterium]
MVLLTGPRQVGKTTLLRKLAVRKLSYVSLDKPDTRFSAKQNLGGFIDRLKLPVLIDEVQYVPELFPYIKIIVDEAGKNVLFWLTGS